MTERDVLEEAREKVRYLDEARAYGITPLEGALSDLIIRLVDALAESRAEVERLRAECAEMLLSRAELADEAQRLRSYRDRMPDWKQDRDEALAAIERVRGWYGTVRYALTPHQQREFDRALDGGDQS